MPGPMKKLLTNEVKLTNSSWYLAREFMIEFAEKLRRYMFRLYTEFSHNLEENDENRL